MNRANGIRSKIFKIAAPPHFPGPQGANPWTIDPKPTGIHRARARAFVLLPFRTADPHGNRFDGKFVPVPPEEDDSVFFWQFVQHSTGFVRARSLSK